MQHQVVPYQTIMNEVDTALNCQFQHSEKLLEAYLRPPTHKDPDTKITLTNQALFITQFAQSSSHSTHFLLLTPTLKFQKIVQKGDGESKTPTLVGFTLINQNLQAAHFHLQFSSLAELWVNRLGTTLNEIGFFQQFRIIGQIGKGSTSTVYRVQRINDGSIFAAKAFAKSFLESKVQRKESVFNEISLLRQMQHQNILRLVGVYQTNTTIYMITEHLSGGTLIQRLNSKRGFSLAQTRQIMRGIIQGLFYLHRFGIMHRDIKLQNIMFRSQQSLSVVIVDFGLAAFCEDDSYIFYRCGTPGYIAPEIIHMQGLQKIDVSCDVFSAGIIFHILLTNRYVFEGSNNNQVYKKNKQMNIDLTTDQYKNIDRSGLELLKEMLQKDVNDRINTEDILWHSFLQTSESVSQKQPISPAATNLQQNYNYQL